MPYRVDPTSHDGRANLLNRAIQSAISDRAAGREYVPADWVEAASDFLKTYQPKVDAISQQMGARSIEIQERDVAIAKLAMYVRHGWQVLRLRVQRFGQPKGVLRLYGLPLEGALPQYARPDEWLSYARTFVSGDKKAVAQGYEPAVCPSAAEIQAELTSASAEVSDVSSADAEVDEAQAAAAQDVDRANELISDLVDYLRFNLRKLDGPSQRRIMRRYGIRFYYRKGETRDPDDVPIEEEAA